MISNNVIIFSGEEISPNGYHTVCKKCMTESWLWGEWGSVPYRAQIFLFAINTVPGQL
jgi:hypothetical protein